MNKDQYQILLSIVSNNIHTYGEAMKCASKDKAFAAARNLEKYFTDWSEIKRAVETLEPKE